MQLVIKIGNQAKEIRDCGREREREKGERERDL
jgi:hypothetical protein